MKRIKFLHVFIVLLLVVYGVNNIGSLYIEFFTDFNKGYRSVSSQFIFGYYTQYVGMAISVLTFVGLFYTHKALLNTIKGGYFNEKAASYFLKASYLFLSSGICSFIFNLLLFQNSEEVMLFTGMSKDFLLMLLGFGLLIVADILKNGNSIKIENDLTI